NAIARVPALLVCSHGWRSQAHFPDAAVTDSTEHGARLNRTLLSELAGVLVDAGRPLPGKFGSSVDIFLMTSITRSDAEMLAPVLKDLESQAGQIACELDEDLRREAKGTTDVSMVLRFAARIVANIRELSTVVDTVLSTGIAAEISD